MQLIVVFILSLHPVPILERTPRFVEVVYCKIKYNFAHLKAFVKQQHIFTNIIDFPESQTICSPPQSQQGVTATHTKLHTESTASLFSITKTLEQPQTKQ